MSDWAVMAVTLSVAWATAATLGVLILRDETRLLRMQVRALLVLQRRDRP